MKKKAVIRQLCWDIANTVVCLDIARDEKNTDFANILNGKLLGYCSVMHLLDTRLDWWYELNKDGWGVKVLLPHHRLFMGKELIEDASIIWKYYKSTIAKIELEGGIDL